MQLDEQFRALADPTRRSILRQVWSQPASAGDIARHFDISRPAVSRHLRVLRESKLVRFEARGTARYYQTDRNAFAFLREQIDAFWDDALPRLKSLVESEHHSGGN